MTDFRVMIAELVKKHPRKIGDNVVYRRGSKGTLIGKAGVVVTNPDEDGLVDVLFGEHGQYACAVMNLDLVDSSACGHEKKRVLEAANDQHNGLEYCPDCGTRFLNCKFPMQYIRLDISLNNKEPHK